MPPIKNLILDLGGVILDIDFALTHKAFEQQGVQGFQNLYSQYSATPFFVNFEKGKVETRLFFDHIRKICGCPLSDEVIRDCWNALLIGFEPAKLEWLQQVSKKYRTFLLSNTNILHYQAFSKMYYEIAGREFDKNFEKAYYSHEMGLRKPDAGCYEAVLTEQNLEPAETLFVDDTLKNTEAAEKLGLQAIHLAKPQTVLELGI